MGNDLHAVGLEAPPGVVELIGVARTDRNAAAGAGQVARKQQPEAPRAARDKGNLTGHVLFPEPVDGPSSDDPGRGKCGRQARPATHQGQQEHGVILPSVVLRRHANRDDSAHVGVFPTPYCEPSCDCSAATRCASIPRHRIPAASCPHPRFGFHENRHRRGEP
jgi:hypothetical protein